MIFHKTIINIQTKGTFSSNCPIEIEIKIEKENDSKYVGMLFLEACKQPCNATKTINKKAFKIFSKG